MASFFCRFAVSAALLTFSTAEALPQSTLDRSWTILESGLSDKNTENRTAAVHLLGMLTGDAKASQLAKKALSDEKPEVREAATDALGSLKERSSVPELKDVIQNDKEAAVVLGAARALIAMDDPLGYGVFYAVLTGEKKSGAGLMEDQKKMLRDPKKLAQFGFVQGVGFVPFGGIGLTVIKSLTKDDVSPVRAAAAKVLAADPDPKSLAALEAATGDPSWIVQVAAIAAIAQRNDQTTISTLEMRLDEPKEAVRYTAAAAIIHLNDVKNVKPAVVKRRMRSSSKH
jgi:HEAT repeat protein